MRFGVHVMAVSEAPTELGGGAEVVLSLPSENS